MQEVVWVCSEWLLVLSLSSRIVVREVRWEEDIGRKKKGTYKHCTNSSSISKRVKPPYFGSCASSVSTSVSGCSLPSSILTSFSSPASVAIFLKRRRFSDEQYGDEGSRSSMEEYFLE